MTYGGARLSLFASLLKCQGSRTRLLGSWVLGSCFFNLLRVLRILWCFSAFEDL